jgi:hypothetical protein
MENYGNLVKYSPVFLFKYKKKLIKSLKVKPLREWLLKVFLKYWKPGWNVAVDKCMIGFTGT